MASSKSAIWRSATPCLTSRWGGAGSMVDRFKRVLVTGGAGYIGSSLVPKLVAAGYETVVLDLYLYGEVFAALQSSRLIEVRGDLRNRADVRRALAGCDAVIHLACISNDPSFDLDP